MPTLELTDEELKAVYGWAGMAGQGFAYGPPPPGFEQEPGNTALAKVKRLLGVEDTAAAAAE